MVIDLRNLASQNITIGASTREISSNFDGIFRSETTEEMTKRENILLLGENGAGYWPAPRAG